MFSSFIGQSAFDNLPDHLNGTIEAFGKTERLAYKCTMTPQTQIKAVAPLIGLIFVTVIVFNVASLIMFFYNLIDIRWLVGHYGLDIATINTFQADDYVAMQYRRSCFETVAARPSCLNVTNSTRLTLLLIWNWKMMFVTRLFK
ncbi:hypothetical protein M3Y97_00013100 [Aphelenchoides bicaudatus]|nr:hypothetical protein M3Y97_00013100 [Aphelenchoides bicaudatus]